MLVRVLGLKDYHQVWDLQKSLVERRLRGEIPDTLLLLEHPPVYTIGLSSRQAVPDGLPYPVYRVERGGDLTYHGPGQLVGYPIIHLGEHGLKPRTYMRTLEAILIEALGKLGVGADQMRGFTGVWAGGRKIASIGVAVKDQISYHGFALNVDCDLAPFRSIYPCKLEPDQITSIHALLGRTRDSTEVIRHVADTFLAYLCRPAVPV